MAVLSLHTNIMLLPYVFKEAKSSIKLDWQVCIKLGKMGGQ